MSQRSERIDVWHVLMVHLAGSRYIHKAVCIPIEGVSNTSHITNRINIQELESNFLYPDIVGMATSYGPFSVLTMNLVESLDGVVHVLGMGNDVGSFLG